MRNLKEILIGAVNIYRTKDFIVKQNIALDYDFQGNSRIHSDDTYILRNRKLDKEYERIFYERESINGKRIHSATYIRTYIK